MRNKYYKLIAFFDNSDFFSPKPDKAKHAQIFGLFAFALNIILFIIGGAELQAWSLGIVVVAAVGLELFQVIAQVGYFSLMDIYFSVQWAFLIYMLTKLIS
jgi:hypothetical protein